MLLLLLPGCNKRHHLVRRPCPYLPVDVVPHRHSPDDRRFLGRRRHAIDGRYLLQVGWLHGRKYCTRTACLTHLAAQYRCLSRKFWSYESAKMNCVTLLDVVCRQGGDKQRHAGSVQRCRQQSLRRLQRHLGVRRHVARRPTVRRWWGTCRCIYFYRHAPEIEMYE